MNSVARTISLFALLIGLGSCQSVGSTPGGGVASVACETFAPIRWSRKDTPPTVSQVVEHNRTGRAVCRREGRWK